MNELVQFLSQGDHPVQASLRPERNLTILRECLDRGFVHVKFTDTRGGTELGIPIDRERSDLSAADAGSGQITLVGDITLDYVPVTCVATIDLASLDGAGRLELAGEPSGASPHVASLG